MARNRGVSKATPNNLLLNELVFYKDYVIGTDSPEKPETKAKCLGATSGGGSFSAVPTVRTIPADGIKTNTKGFEVIDEWVVTMTVNVFEFTANNIKLALGAAQSDEETDGFTHITGKEDFADADYASTFTALGTLKGSNKPVIITLDNGLSLNGLSVSTADKSEAVVPMTITGHYDLDNMDKPPFDIYYPKGE